MTTDPNIDSEAFEEVSMILYDNNLDDNDLKFLAADHNKKNVGSTQTRWANRVHTCHRWLYDLAELDMEVDETPK